eukprot:209450_1
MGNQHSSCPHRGNTKHRNACDDFIVKHVHNNKANDTFLSTESYDERRLVFVSVSGLYQSWKRVPSVALYTSFLIMELKQKWIHQPFKYIHEWRERLDIECGSLNTATIKEFVDLLRWKHAQGLVFWMFDEADVDCEEHSQDLNDNPLIAPFWYRLNAKLTSLYDHVTARKYDPLRFDERYWRNLILYQYSTDLRSILTEFYFVTFKSNTMQEIVYQSNPKTLRPIVEYHNKSQFKLSPSLISEEEGTETENDFSFKMMEEIAIASTDYV